MILWWPWAQGEQAARVNTVFPGPIESDRIHNVFRAMDSLRDLEEGTTSKEFLDLMILRRDGGRTADFRYPGPKPQLRETAIIMLADAVEGASRSLHDPTPARLRGLVSKIVNMRLSEGQLEESGLNLSDVAKIREAFITVLTGRFHTRISYPELPTIKGGTHAPPLNWG